MKSATSRVDGQLQPVTDFDFELLDAIATEMEREDFPLHRSNNGCCIDACAIRLESGAMKLRAVIKQHKAAGIMR